MRILFGILGALGLGLLIQRFGWDILFSQVKLLGFWIIPLTFSFLPTLLGYSVGWMLSVEKSILDRAYCGKSFFFKLFSFGNMTAISLAWNNLTPFLKVGGEPVKILLLEKKTGRIQALQSVIVYNVMHFLGTLESLFLGALWFVLTLPHSNSVENASWGVIIGIPVGALVLYGIRKKNPQLTRHNQNKKWKKNLAYIFWSFKILRRYVKKNKVRFWGGVQIETAARFIEGLTFFFTFMFFKQTATFWQCALLDVGRTLFDTVFFFVPYQLGSREGGVMMVARQAFDFPAGIVLTAALVYRVVEIIWIGIGYVAWLITRGKSKSEVIFKSMSEGR